MKWPLLASLTADTNGSAYGERTWSVQVDPSQYRSCPCVSPGFGYHPAGGSPVTGVALGGVTLGGVTTVTLPSVMNDPKVGSGACPLGELPGAAENGPVGPGAP